MTTDLTKREDAAIGALMDRGRTLGRRLTVATIGIAIGLTAAWIAIAFVVADPRGARLAARGGILVFVFSLAGVNRVGKVVMRRRVDAWVPELAREHGVSREVLAETARIFS